jgi:hypothetical protein
MQTSTYSVHRDGRGWVVVEEFGRTRRRAGVFSTLVAALEFVGNEQELPADACLASRPTVPVVSAPGPARVVSGVKRYVHIHV